MDPIYRIICYKNENYSLTIRGGNVVFALTNHFDRYQHWIKDERHGATIKDSEGQPAFAVINKATGQAISHCPKLLATVYNKGFRGRPLVKYNVNSCDKSVLWTMSGLYVYNGFRTIRRVDHISLCFHTREDAIHDGHLVDLTVPGYLKRETCWDFKFEKVSPSTFNSLFSPSQQTVKITCKVKVDYNLAIDKDGRTVLLVPSNPKDKYQHWIKETACGVPVKDEEGQEAFALVNKTTGLAIKHGFGHNYLVQVAPFNTNYMDPSLLWTKSSWDDEDFGQIRMQNNIDLVFTLFDDGRKYPLLGLSKSGEQDNQIWKIEDFE